MGKSSFAAALSVLDHICPSSIQICPLDNQGKGDHDHPEEEPVSSWQPWTEDHEALAVALDRATGVDVDAGRDLADDEESFDGLTVAERALAERLDALTKATPPEDEDAVVDGRSRDYTGLGDGLTVNTAMVLDQLTGVRP